MAEESLPQGERRALAMLELAGGRPGVIPYEVSGAGGAGGGVGSWNVVDTIGAIRSAVAAIPAPVQEVDRGA